MIITAYNNYKSKLFALLLAAVLTGCSDGGGGGGGIGGTGKQVIQDGLIVGSVDGFGSIIINDQRFETDEATITINGSEANLADLRIGINLIAGVDTISKTANELQYQSDVSGPIQTSAADFSGFNVLGQSVVVTTTTVYDELLLTQLVPGVLVEVSGNRNANGEIVASYIRRAPQGSRYFAVGTVESNDSSAGPGIPGAQIDFSEVAAAQGVTNADFETQVLVPGTEVRVFVPSDFTYADSNALNGTLVLPASAIDVLEAPAYKAGDVIQIFGFMSIASPGNEFAIEGFDVTVDGETQAISSFGVPMEFPQNSENREVLIDGIADADNGKIVITVIQFLDQL